MGQRTQIILRKISRDGETTTKAYHFQWGFGRVMPMAAMEMVSSLYTTKDFQSMQPSIDDKPFESEVLDNLNLLNGEKVTRLVWNCFDNNNGALVIIAREKATGSIDMAFGWIMGTEDMSGHFNDDYTEYYPTDSTLRGYVSTEYFMAHNGGSKYTSGKFSEMFRTWMDYEEIDDLSSLTRQ